MEKKGFSYSLMEVLWVKKCIKNYKSLFNILHSSKIFSSTAFTTINGVYRARRNDTVSFLDQRREITQEEWYFNMKLVKTKEMRENTMKVKTKDVSREERFNRFM